MRIAIYCVRGSVILRERDTCLKNKFTHTILHQKQNTLVLSI